MLCFYQKFYNVRALLVFLVYILSIYRLININKEKELDKKNTNLSSDQFEKTIKIFRSDNAKEYFSHDLSSFLSFEKHFRFQNFVKKINK